MKKLLFAFLAALSAIPHTMRNACYPLSKPESTLECLFPHEEEARRLAPKSVIGFSEGTWCFAGGSSSYCKITAK
jgi:hypothetical protein